MKFFAKNWLWLAGGIAGAFAGFLYWKYVGCSSGSCPITSKPLNSSIYGSLLGALFFSLFKTGKR
ncbi:hypothetical protein [uncultured Fluviicola sp.]|uniref:hypothetical protein n=1 Tax=uncultured Fluviicola sp. TaxID=463303 RepID=UPI0025D155EE|nr:hypothetical protein [uncultured Fluviicola sp.]